MGILKKIQGFARNAEVECRTNCWLDDWKQFLFRQVRSVLNKEVGFNPLASQRKVDNYIENIMVAKKVKVRTLPKPLSSHYDRLDLRIDKGQRVDSVLRQHTIWME